MTNETKQTLKDLREEVFNLICMYGLKTLSYKQLEQLKKVLKE